MTSNQIAYLNTLLNYEINKYRAYEEARHNQVQEQYNLLSLNQQQRLKQSELAQDLEKFNLNLAETRRSNQIKESQNLFGLKEQYRHNYRSESLQETSINESIRHNLMYEGVMAADLNERVRNNKFINDLERARYEWNKSYQASQLDLTQRQINLGYYNAQIQAAKVANDYALGVESNRIRDKQVDYNYSIDQQNVDISKSRADKENELAWTRTLTEREKAVQEQFNSRIQTWREAKNWVLDYGNMFARYLDAILPF